MLYEDTHLQVVINAADQHKYTSKVVLKLVGTPGCHPGYYKLRLLSDVLKCHLLPYSSITNALQNSLLSSKDYKRLHEDYFNQFSSLKGDNREQSSPPVWHLVSIKDCPANGLQSL